MDNTIIPIRPLGGLCKDVGKHIKVRSQNNVLSRGIIRIKSFWKEEYGAE
jgi:hypothetical protein